MSTDRRSVAAHPAAGPSRPAACNRPELRGCIGDTWCDYCGKAMPVSTAARRRLADLIARLSGHANDTQEVASA